MGISDIFDISKSNLSGLLENNEQLKISKAIHKAFIEVDEDGTEVRVFCWLNDFKTDFYMNSS